MKKPSRLARRIFRPLLDANEPVKLDLRGVDRNSALEAIRESAMHIRCTDAADPLEALYVFTSGSASLFISPWQKFKTWIRMLFWWYRPMS